MRPSAIVTKRLATFDAYLSRSHLTRDWEGGPVLQAWRDTCAALISELEALE